MSHWLEQLHDEYRRGYPDAVRGVRQLQQKVQIGQASPRDVAILKGLDRIDVGCCGIGQDHPVDESSVYISDGTLRTLMNLVFAAMRTPATNRLLAGSSPLRQTAGVRQHGGAQAHTQISGAYDMHPFFGASHGGSHMSASHSSIPMASHHAGVSHHGPGFRRGGGGGAWLVPGGWPGYWGDDCYVDAYGRIVCWTAYGWRVVA